MTGAEDSAAARMSLRDARQKDFAFLAERLRNQRVTLSAAERRFLADHLEGKSRPAHRPKSTRVSGRRIAMALRVLALEAEGVKKTAAVAEIADLFKVSEATVHQAIKDTPLARVVIAGAHSGKSPT